MDEANPAKEVEEAKVEVSAEGTLPSGPVKPPGIIVLRFS